MSFYRSLLAACAAFALILPVFADETTTTTTTTEATDQGPQVVQQTTESKDDQATQVAQATTEIQPKVDLNKATVKELTTIKGITPAKAKAIVSYRKKNGDFKATDELQNVKGFQKMTAEQLKEIQDQLTVD